MTQPPQQPIFGALQLLAFPTSALRGKRFQTIDEIQESIIGQLMVTGRTVRGPKVPPLKGTEVSLSYVQCFLYLVFSSINVSIFHITWLDTFWTDFVYLPYEGETHAYEHLRATYTNTHIHTKGRIRRSKYTHTSEMGSDELKRSRRNLGYGDRKIGLSPSPAIYQLCDLGKVIRLLEPSFP